MLFQMSKLGKSNNQKSHLAAVWIIRNGAIDAVCCRSTSNVGWKRFGIKGSLFCLTKDLISKTFACTGVTQLVAGASK